MGGAEQCPQIDSWLKAESSAAGSVPEPSFGVMLFTEKYQEQIAGFFESYKLAEDEQAHFQDIWEVCFGEQGYLTVDRSAEQVAADRELLLKSWFLATFAHGALYKKDPSRIQMRGTGERYINHPLRSTFEYARKYKPQAWVLAGELCHDTVEDTLITNKDIQGFLGMSVAHFVDRLSKVSRTQKEVHRTITMMKLLRPFIDGETEGVAASAGKVIENLDNIRTLSGKPPADQIAIAQDSLENYVPLAKILGLDAEASELANTCFRVIGPSIYPDEFMRRFESEAQQFSLIDSKDILNPVEKRIRSFPFSSNVSVHVSKPNEYEIAASVKDRTIVTVGNFYFEVDLVVSDHPTDGRLSMDLADPANFGLLASSLVNWLNFADEFERPAGKFVGYLDTISSVKALSHNLQKQEHSDYRLVLLNEENQIPLRIRVYRKSDYEIEKTSLTYLSAVALRDEDKLGVSDQTTGELLALQRSLAEQKFANLVRNVADLHYRQRGLLIDHMLTTFPNSIVVIGEKAKGPRVERIRRPLPRGATVLDYALAVAPNSWFWIENVNVNGRPGKIDQVLVDGDRINLVFDQTKQSHVKPWWMDAVAVDQAEAQSRVADRLVQRISELESSEERESNERGKEHYKAERERLIGVIRHRGWLIIDELVGNLNEMGLALNQLDIEELKEVNPREFAYAVGLGRVDRQLIIRVAEGLNKYRENQTVVVVKMPNKPGRLSLVLQRFALPRGQAGTGINVIYHRLFTKWGDTVRAEIRISKKDAAYQWLNKVLEEIRRYIDPQGEDKDSVIKFDTYLQFKDWLGRHEVSSA